MGQEEYVLDCCWLIRRPLTHSTREKHSFLLCSSVILKRHCRYCYYYSSMRARDSFEETNVCLCRRIFAIVFALQGHLSHMLYLNRTRKTNKDFRLHLNPLPNKLRILNVALVHFARIQFRPRAACKSTLVRKQSRVYFTSEETG